MAAANYNFSIEKGTSFVISFQYQDSNEVPLDLTNWCARIKWIDNNNNTTIWYTNSITDDYSFTLEPTIGRIVMKIPASKTALIDWVSARYDLDLQEPTYLYSTNLEDNKKVYRILEGTISIIESNVPYEPFACQTGDTTDCRTCA